MTGKIADECAHRGMPEPVEPKEIHLVESFVGEEFVESDAIGGDKNTGTVFTEAAMHEDLFVGIVAKNPEELPDLGVSGSSPAANGNVDEVHAQRFRCFLFPVDFGTVFAAKIDDGGDAQFLQLRQAVIA